MRQTTLCGRYKRAVPVAGTVLVLLLVAQQPLGTEGELAAARLRGRVHAGGSGLDRHAVLAETKTTEDGFPWIEVLTWHPRAFLYHNFLTSEECDHIVELAKPTIARSTVVDAETGKPVLDPVRTSYGAFLRHAQTDTVASVEARIAAWSHLPPDNGEDIQVLRYTDGQKYDEHLDWFDPEELKAQDNMTTNRIATVLMYLSDVEEGGETALTQGHWLDGDAHQHAWKPSSCAANSVYVRAKKGDALLFWDLHPDGQTGDQKALHVGCPVLKGAKWSATKWLHNGRYQDGSEPVPQQLDGNCADFDDDCEKWASAGFCTREEHRIFMIGDADNVGQCLKACKLCVPCPPGDVLCQRKNLRLKQALQRGEETVNVSG